MNDETQIVLMDPEAVGRRRLLAARRGVLLPFAKGDEVQQGGESYLVVAVFTEVVDSLRMVRTVLIR
jgi:hypothetical protein